MSKPIIIDMRDRSYGIVSGLWQYDYGQVLKIQDYGMPTAVEIHFAMQSTGGDAVPRIGTTRDGVTEVVIPDSMLENDGVSSDYRIYAFIYLTDEKSGETSKRIDMLVRSRPKPEAFDTPEEAELFRETVLAVNEAADRAEAAETAAEGHAKEAGTKANDASLSAGAAAKSAGNAAISETNASKYAQNADTSANEARQSAEAAAKSAQEAAEAGGSGGGVDVTGAKPGQLIVVKEVDADGVPTAWETMDRTHWTEYGMKEVLPECNPAYIEDTGRLLSLIRSVWLVAKPTR